MLRRESILKEADLHTWIYEHRAMWVEIMSGLKLPGGRESGVRALGGDQHLGGGRDEETE